MIDSRKIDVGAVFLSSPSSAGGPDEKAVLGGVFGRSQLAIDPADLILYSRYMVEIMGEKGGVRAPVLFQNKLQTVDLFSNRLKNHMESMFGSFNNLEEHSKQDEI